MSSEKLALWRLKSNSLQFRKLKATVPDHKLVRDVERMSSEFDSAATKFSIAA